MTRIVLSLAALGLLAACAQYRPPRANCFSFLAHTGAMGTPGSARATIPDCQFAPIDTLEGGLEV